MGQNFLVDERVVPKIIAAARLATGEAVLEIGPGGGILTAALLRAGARVIAVEKDERLIAKLREKFAGELASGQLELIAGDILNYDPHQLAGDYKIVANIPYYLTGQIIRRFLTARHQPRAMILMLQKEVGERILARDGRHSLLSLAVWAYGRPRLAAMVRAGAFRPRPKVDSVILVVGNITRAQFVNRATEDKFFTLIHQGFASKRKQLKNNLPGGANLLNKCRLNDKIRAENLTLADWLCLIKYF